MVEQQGRLEDLLNEFATKVFTGEELEASNQIIASYERHQEYINGYVALYERYIGNRKELDRRVITVMEEGKMGVGYKTAVIDIYGQKSRGQTVKLNSMYTKLRNKTKYLAQLEKKIIDNKREEIEFTMEYDTLMDRLLSLLTTKRTKPDPTLSERGSEVDFDPSIADISHDHPTLNRIRSAIGLYSYNELLFLGF